MASFVETYVDYASGRSSAPAVFHKLAALSVCAAALENRVWIKAGFKPRVYPGFWLCLVGKSDVHKSSAVNIAASLLVAAKADTALPHDFSREAFIEHMAERPYGLLVWSEIGSALEAFSRDYSAGTLSLLIDMWDSKPSMTRLTKGSGPIRIEYPALSILAAGKPRWFQDMGLKAVLGGFLGRWLFAWEDTPSPYMSFFGRDGYGGDAEAYQRGSLVERLVELAQVPEHEMKGGEDSEAGQVLDAWGEEMVGKWGTDEADQAEFSKRSQEQVVKLALAIQASQGPSELEALHPKAVEQAIELWGYLFESGKRLVSEITGHSTDADEIARVLSAISERPRIRQRELLRKTRMKLKTMMPVIETLLTSGQVNEEREIQEQGGLPTIWYRALK